MGFDDVVRPSMGSHVLRIVRKRVGVVPKKRETMHDQNMGDASMHETGFTELLGETVVLDATRNASAGVPMFGTSLDFDQRVQRLRVPQSSVFNETRSDDVHAFLFDGESVDRRFRRRLGRAYTSSDDRRRSVACWDA